MLNFVCVKWGGLYSADYVNRLYAMVARNLAVGTPGRFVCYTDDHTDIRQEIHCRPLPRGVSGWWNKLFLFAPGQFAHNDRVLYFDLDTVIIGSLDEIATYDGDFAILRDFYRPDGLQSSVMAWRANVYAEIWQRWNREGRPESVNTATSHGDQAWIESVVEKPEIWQDLFPGKFVSFKRDCIPFPPEGASVVCFHGEPRPHDCGRSWVEAMWTESEVGHFQLAMVPNVTLDQIREQSRHSATLGLPRLKSQQAKTGKVAIIGGGPSLNDAITLAELSRLKADGCAFWALNATYDWLLDHGIVADAHVLLDARSWNARFLRRSRRETTYYLASQCDCGVYDSLMQKDRKIIRYDLDVMGDCGTTVGTHAIAVAFTEGYREIHLYGYDSSYRGDQAHAYDQENIQERIVDAHVGEGVFRAAPWMVRQAQDFEGLAAALVAAGASIIVHGDGLLPYLAHQMGAPRPAQIRAQEILRRLPDGLVSGAEIGVFRGEMSVALLERKDLSLIMVDSWEADGSAYNEKCGDWHADLTKEQQDGFYDQAMRSIAFAADRTKVYRRRSTAASCEVPDRSLDFVFLDADHSYKGCWTDLAHWAPTVKPGGLLCGHDYDNPDFPEFGVKNAVDEYASAMGLSVELGENLTWFIRL